MWLGAEVVVLSTKLGPELGTWYGYIYGIFIDPRAT